MKLESKEAVWAAVLFFGFVLSIISSRHLNVNQVSLCILFLSIEDREVWSCEGIKRGIAKLATLSCTSRCTFKKMCSFVHRLKRWFSPNAVIQVKKIQDCSWLHHSNNTWWAGPEGLVSESSPRSDFYLCAHVGICCRTQHHLSGRLLCQHGRLHPAVGELHLRLLHDLLHWNAVQRPWVQRMHDTRFGNKIKTSAKKRQIGHLRTCSRGLFLCHFGAYLN